MVAVDMATAYIHPWLLLVGDISASGWAGESQGAEPHRALGPSCISLLPLGLQLLQGGCPKEASWSAPQEGGPTQVDKGAIPKHVGLILHLGKAMTELERLELQDVAE